MASAKPNIVIQTAFLGDLLLAIPLFKQIRKRFPQQKLYLVCREGLGSLLKSINLIDEVFEIKKSDRDSYNKILSDLNKLEFENLFCPHMSFRSALFSSRIRAEKKIGFDTWWNFFAFDERLPRDMNLPDAIRQLSLISPFSQDIAAHVDQYSDEHSITILGPVPDWASMEMREKIQFELPKVFKEMSLTIENRKIACLFPGSVWATKQWKIEGFIEVARRFQKEGFEVIVLGSQPEMDLGQKILNEVPGVYNLIAQTNLQETLAILKQADVVVTNDSAGQHLSALAGVPTVSIFGPTVLEFGYRPWNSKAVVVENKTITCRPCGKHGHQKCPIGTHICMTSVSAEQIWAEALKITQSV